MRVFSFEALRNPILAVEGWAVKDACLLYQYDTYFLFSSAFFEKDGEERCHIAGFTSKDMREWTLSFVRGGENLEAYGLASPDICVAGDLYILSYNTWGDHPQQPNRLLYATSKDLRQWTWDLPLAPGTCGEVRAIDAALAFWGDRFFLCWKERQTLAFAWANTLGQAVWTRIPSQVSGWYENCQFLTRGGQWHLLGTGHGHKPYLLRMEGSPEDTASWGSWRETHALLPPEEGFNTLERANAAYLLPDMADGYSYLLYAGTTVKEPHLGRGDCTLGLGRSMDLQYWEVGAGRGEPS